IARWVAASAAGYESGWVLRPTPIHRRAPGRRTWVGGCAALTVRVSLLRGDPDRPARFRAVTGFVILVRGATDRSDGGPGRVHHRVRWRPGAGLRGGTGGRGFPGRCGGAAPHAPVGPGDEGDHPALRRARVPGHLPEPALPGGAGGQPRRRGRGVPGGRRGTRRAAGGRRG